MTADSTQGEALATTDGQVRPRWAEARILDEPDEWDAMPAGTVIPLPSTSRRHAAALGPASYELERVDQAQPLRTHVPEVQLARAGTVILWCRVGLAVVGTVILVLVMVHFGREVLSW